MPRPRRGRGGALPFAQGAQYPRSYLQLCRQMYRTGGIRVFCAGFGPILLGAFPRDAASFSGAELAHRWMELMWPAVEQVAR